MMVRHPDFDIGSFLAERDRPASVATVSERGRPALASMWYWFGDQRFWFHSPKAGPAPFLRAAAKGRLVSVMIETFNPAGRVIKLRSTGAARIDAFDRERVVKIYDRYLASTDAWNPEWNAQVDDDAYQLWSVEPTVGSAVQFPRLQDAGGTYRWRTVDEFISAITAI